MGSEVKMEWNASLFDLTTNNTELQVSLKNFTPNKIFKKHFLNTFLHILLPLKNFLSPTPFRTLSAGYRPAQLWYYNVKLHRDMKAKDWNPHFDNLNSIGSGSIWRSKHSISMHYAYHSLITNNTENNSYFSSWQFEKILWYSTHVIKMEVSAFCQALRKRWK